VIISGEKSFKVQAPDYFLKEAGNRTLWKM